jgi:hypothetical protein
MHILLNLLLVATASGVHRHVYHLKREGLGRPQRLFPVLLTEPLSVLPKDLILPLQVGRICKEFKRETKREGLKSMAM